MANARLLDEALPDGLLPFKGRLSERFYDRRRAVVAFVKEVVLPNQSEFSRQVREEEAKVADPLDAPEPRILRELREEAKKRGVYNFFLPEVSGREYRRHA
jgi:hypothetical protein